MCTPTACMTMRQRACHARRGAELGLWWVMASTGEVLNRDDRLLPMHVRGAVAIRGGVVAAVSASGDRLCTEHLRGGGALQAALRPQVFYNNAFSMGAGGFRDVHDQMMLRCPSAVGGGNARCEAMTAEHGKLRGLRLLEGVESEAAVALAAEGGIALVRLGAAGAELLAFVPGTVRLSCTPRENTSCPVDTRPAHSGVVSK